MSLHIWDPSKVVLKELWGCKKLYCPCQHRVGSLKIRANLCLPRVDTKKVNQNFINVGHEFFRLRGCQNLINKKKQSLFKTWSESWDLTKVVVAAAIAAAVATAVAAVAAATILPNRYNLGDNQKLFITKSDPKAQKQPWNYKSFGTPGTPGTPGTTGTPGTLGTLGTPGTSG